MPGFFPERPFFLMNTKVTIKDIAAACGVSTATVSYVLNNSTKQSISEATRKKVLHYANMVGYAPHSVAKALALGNTGNLGVYCPHPENSEHKLAIIRALAAEAEKYGRRLTILTESCTYRNDPNVDAIFALDISADEFSCVGDNTFVPLIYLEGDITDYLFFSIAFDMEHIKAKFLAASAKKKAGLIAERFHCGKQADKTASIFDVVLTPKEAASFDEPDTVLIKLGEGFDYEAYARSTIEVFYLALERKSIPFESHHILIK